MRLIRPTLVSLVLFTGICGLAYPLAVTGLARTFFPVQAKGDLSLIGQPFSDPKYFWGRPSATSPTPCNAAASSGSNLGPTNPALRDAVAARVTALKASDPANAAPIPIDLVTTSASGLDPHISPEAALWQVARVARIRHLSEEKIHALVNAHVEPRQWGVLGEPRVNVLLLNLALDKLASSPNN